MTVAAATSDTSELRFPGIYSAGSDDFRRDVLAGLSASERSVPCKYLYDSVGSALFDRICELPEYYPTRTELALTRDCASQVAAAIGPRASIFEPGAGSSVKIRALLDALERPLAYHPIDISGDHLRSSAEALTSDYPNTLISPVEADFTRAFGVADAHGVEGRRVIYFPGSTIGNFEPEEATRLLASFASPLRQGDLILLGWDRFKDPSVLVPAYDDAQGVTAAFITNLLGRMQRELGAQLDETGFELWTRWQPERERIRIGLRSLRAQSITLEATEFHFAPGDELFVEHSHKYRDETMAQILAAAGLCMVDDWTDARSWFSLSLLTPV